MSYLNKIALEIISNGKGILATDNAGTILKILKRGGVVNLRKQTIF